MTTTQTSPKTAFVCFCSGDRTPASREFFNLTNGTNVDDRQMSAEIRETQAFSGNRRSHVPAHKPRALRPDLSAHEVGLAMIEFQKRVIRSTIQFEERVRGAG